MALRSSGKRLQGTEGLVGRDCETPEVVEYSGSVESTVQEQVPLLVPHELTDFLAD